MSINFITSSERFLNSDNPVQEVIEIDDTINNIQKVKMGKVEFRITSKDMHDLIQYKNSNTLYICLSSVYSKLKEYLNMLKMKHSLSVVNSQSRNKILSNIYKDDNNIKFKPHCNFSKFLNEDYKLFNFFKKLKVKISKINKDGKLEKLKLCNLLFTSQDYSYSSLTFPSLLFNKRKGKFYFKTKNNYFPTDLSYINLFYNNHEDIVIDLFFEVFYHNPISSKVSHNCESLNYVLTNSVFFTVNSMINHCCYNPPYIKLYYNSVTNKFLLSMNRQELKEWELEYFAKKTSFILYGSKDIVNDILKDIGNYYNYTIRYNEKEGEYHIEVYGNIKAQRIETFIKKTLDKFDICDNVEMYYVFLNYSDADTYDKDDIKAYLIHVLFHTKNFCNKNANKLANKIFSMMTEEQIKKMERFHRLNNFII
jgi:hypothetical protein